ncbi:unnamed protein product [Paramecium octaurelia]|uniref:Acyltransferase 3 domain-containing protein n=1 Tax=Paramecium octaurelia TaxID=43137 RepID=A0A8S1SCV2_PAROT|nr:unnamed protein product [Paramecium octaurelia]
MYILSFLILEVLSFSQDNTSVCIQEMNNLLSLPINQQLQLVLPYYSISGNWVEKFGYYDRCLREDKTYTSLQIDQILYKLNYGFCHSNICSAHDFNSQDAQIIIKNLLNVSGIANLLQMNLEITTLRFYNPLTYYPHLGLGTYVTSTILIILIIMALIDPIMRLIKACQSSHTPDDRDDIKDDQASTPVTTKGEPQENQNLIVKDFSIISNYKKIMNLKTIDPNLAMFNGIRAISFMMVVYGHVCEMTATSTYIQEAMLQYKQWSIIILYDMMYAVDIFFWIGGFFLGYVMCDDKKTQSLKKYPFSIVISVVHRLMRIWPCYLLCIAINSYIIPYLGSGPRWFLEEGATQCPGGAWKNALFIDNFYEDWQLCFGWGWYLTCDFQLFLTCLIPIMIYCLNYKTGSKILILLMILGSLGWGYYLSIHYNFLIPGKNTYNPDYYYKYYVSTYARAPPYFLGLLIGILYRELKQSKGSGSFNILNQCKSLIQTSGSRILFQIVCYGIGAGLVLFQFLGWKKEFNSVQLLWPQWFQHFYHAICRFLFTFAITLITLPNLVGAYDIFNRKFMNNILFKFMAKISFSMYLVHLMTIVIITETFYETPSFYQLDLVTGFVCAVFLSVIFGLMLSLLVELPFGNLDTRLTKLLSVSPKKIEPLLS